MKKINYALISSLCALVMGVLLILWPDVAVNYLVIAIGVLFLVPGIFGLATYLSLLPKARKEGVQVIFPVVALGSLLFGIWLAIMPDFFIGILMYVLGVVLVLGGFNQLAALISARSWVQVPLALYFIPVLIIAAGIVVLFNPFEAAQVPFIVLGASLVVYALTDLFRQWRYRSREQYRQAEVVEIKPEAKEEASEEKGEAKEAPKTDQP